MSRSWAGPAQSPLGRLRALALPLAEGWEGYCLHRRDPQGAHYQQPHRAGHWPLPHPGQGHGGIKGWEGLEAALLLPHLKVA